MDWGDSIMIVFELETLEGPPRFSLQHQHKSELNNILVLSLYLLLIKDCNNKVTIHLYTEEMKVK